MVNEDITNTQHTFTQTIAFAKMLLLLINAAFGLPGRGECAAVCPLPSAVQTAVRGGPEKTPYKYMMNGRGRGVGHTSALCLPQGHLVITHWPPSQCTMYEASDLVFLSSTHAHQFIFTQSFTNLSPSFPITTQQTHNVKGMSLKGP